ncbi:unnamed protein product [Bursaphelenchus okinawaensis]|uniref:EamA domain-containing protein n=1 Tax=Bursaphelenchus okinawaensis TaxID=465554 RepID=A0A811LM94_9BILA|nr:unnamed protein product [Bursaphelenchus okinawaensis]CAG9126043.1 unnamed protein product [Bursaphelenchus okinawaensis]
MEAEEPFVAPSEEKRLSKTLISVLVVLGVSVSWTSASQFTKLALHDEFKAPYFIVWFNTNLMMLCYPFYLVVSCRKSWKTIRQETFDCDRTLLEWLWVTVTLLTLWTMANVLFSVSLGRISASASTSLISCNVFVVFLLSKCFLDERYTVTKSISTVLGVIGVIVICCDKEFAGDVVGVVSVMLAAFSSAMYKVVFKKIVGQAGLGQVSLLMSLLGALNLLLNVIPITLLWYVDVEVITLHNIPWFYLIGSAVLSLTYNFVVNLSIALITPLFVSIGALLGIPLNMIVDILMNNMVVSPTFLVGSILITVSVAINLNYRKK